MPKPNDTGMTLADLRKIIAEHPDLNKMDRTRMRSSIKRFAEVCSRTPEEIIADPATIRSLKKTAAWQIAGLSQSTWANICSSVVAAMTAAGIKVHRRRRNFALTPEWESWMADLSARDRQELHRFAGWCAAQTFTPEMVDAELFKHFYDYLHEQMVQTNPRERWRVHWRAWNKIVTTRGDDAYPIIPDISPPRWESLKWEAFPASLQQEIHAYRAAVTQAANEADDIFNTDRPRSPLKRITVEGYLRRLRILATLLVENGTDIERFHSLGVFCDTALIKQGLKLMMGVRSRAEARATIHATAVALQNVARYLDASEDHRKMLSVIVARAAPERVMATQCNERLNALHDREALLRLITLPGCVMDDLTKVQSPTVRQAQRAQMVALLELLLHVPLRIRNAAELDLAHSIIRPPGGKAGSWLVEIEAEDVKNKKAVHARLGREASALLNLYVTRFRPVLTANNDTRLFTSQSGGGKGPSALSKQLSKFVWREAGVRIHAHLMRHIAAMIYLRANPADYETARLLLGHKQITTTVAFYAQLQAEAAFERLDEILSALREEARAHRGERVRIRKRPKPSTPEDEE